MVGIFCHMKAAERCWGFVSRPLGILTSTDRTVQSKNRGCARRLPWWQPWPCSMSWGWGSWLFGLTTAKTISVLQPHPSDCSVIGLYLRCTLYLRTTADCWLCPEAWWPSLKCQEINKAWEQGSTRNSINGNRLPHPHSLDGFIPRRAFSAPQCLPMDVSIPAHGIGISTPTPSHCPLAGRRSLKLPGNCMLMHCLRSASGELN